MPRLLTAASLLLLAACATQPPLRTDVAPGQSGQAVLSLGAAARVAGTLHSVKLRNIDTRQEAQVTFATGPQAGRAADFDSAAGQGIVEVLNLAPGQYEIFNFESQQPGLLVGTTRFGAQPDFSVPFKVEQGKVTYLGQWLAQSVHTRDLSGSVQTRFFYYIVDDQSARDLAIAKSRMRVAQDAVAGRAVADASKVQHPQVRNTAMGRRELPPGHTH